jgi:hypothetical protein
VKVTRFDTARDLIIVPGRVWNPNSNDPLDLRLVLDTGAAETIVVPELLDELGYSAREHGDPALNRTGVDERARLSSRTSRHP